MNNTRTDLTVVMASDLTLSITEILAEIAQDGIPREIQEGVGSTRVLGRLVAADHDMHVLRALTAYENKGVEDMLRVSEWTGLTAFPELLWAYDMLEQAGVNFEAPAWEELPPGTHSAEDLVRYAILGPRNQVMVDSPYPARDWVRAIEHFAKMRYLPSEWDRKEAARLATAACLDGLSPDGAIEKVTQAIREGVIWSCIEDIFGPEALPNDLLAIHGKDLRRRIRTVVPNGMAQDDFFRLLRDGTPIHMVESYVLYAGIIDPKEIAKLHSDGVHPMRVARARAEGLPEEYWAEVVGPLSSCVQLTVYETWLCSIGAEPGLFTLQELVVDGEVQHHRVAWDSPKQSARSLPADWRRELAEGHVNPYLFELIVGRLPRHFADLTFAASVPTILYDEVVAAIGIAGAGMTPMMLDRLKAPTSYRLQMDAGQMMRFAVLAPTATEGAFLGARSSDAAVWLRLLEAWRTMTPRAVALFEQLRTDADTAALVKHLEASGSRKVFLQRDSVRTEAIGVLAGSGVAPEVSGLHAQVLHSALSGQLRPEGVPPTLRKALNKAIRLLGALMVEFELA